MEDYKNNYPISVILDCFDVKRSTYYRWKKKYEKPQETDEVIELIEQLCMENHF
ncbi:helix-turn-helix domain-containing protein, partial [Streptococcus agalactiae]|nr:helix-turn-helix domain-containing protein [Streptococcus agalactiae]MCC9992834.1 helix-turn-helix domain-containing protein [Streptococcus agalactiae]MCC9997001.1 helix-turn-helix domain-containing protein [Streptococcus agalactiae]